EKWATAFGFNRPISFAMPVDVSLAAFSEDPLALARTGAGFGDVYLSPLHGAALASIAASGGLWRDPVLFEDAPEKPTERVMSEDQARMLTDMLEDTVTT